MSILKKILPDPVFHFVMIGGLLFLLDGFLTPGQNLQYLIDMDQTRIDWIKNTSSKETGDIPSQQQLSNLIDHHIKQEIFFREALAIELEKDDVIVRRRLIEKYKFMLEGMIDTTQASNEQLVEHYQKNQGSFIQPARYSFSHHYFSDEQRDNAQQDAAASLTNLVSTNVKSTSVNNKIGDPFMMRYHYSQLDLKQIANSFGKDFSASLNSLAVGQWSAPIPSIYGWHLVKITHKKADYLPEFEEIADQVQIEFQKHKRILVNDAVYSDLLAKYDIRFPSVVTSDEK